MTPEVYIEEVPRGVPPIAGGPTSIAAFVGWSQQGDTDSPTPIASWKEFETKFGRLDRRSLLGYAVYHFFTNGGKQAYVVRLAGDDGSVLQPNTPVFEDKLLAAHGSGGIELLGRVDQFNLLCVPGETTATVIRQLQEFCQKRRAFLIVDCEPGATFDSLQNGPAAAITGADSINSALYFPWIKAAGPNKQQRLKQYPPCGFVAGIYARTDTTRGVWKAPAGIDASLIGASAPAIALTEPECEMLNRRGINCIRDFEGYGTVVWGNRTLQQPAADWKYINLRRLLLFLEESIYRGTQWVVFEPNAEPLWAKIRSTVGSFMAGVFRDGALVGMRQEEAYFVQCGRDTMTQADLDAGTVNIVVGFAPLRPAEFVIIKIRIGSG